MTGRRAIAAVLAAAAAAGAAGCGGDDAPADDAGPLRPGRAPSAWTTYGGAREPFFVGNQVVVNAGDAPVTLRAVRLVGATPGLHVVRARAAGTRRRTGLIAGGPTRIYERQTDLRPLDGAQVPPKSPIGVEIIADLAAPGPGRYALRDLEVTYESGGRTHRMRTGSAFAICRGPRWAKRECPEVPVPAAR